MIKRTIGVIGDFDPAKRSHPATNDGLRHAGEALRIAADIRWLPILQAVLKVSSKYVQSM